jgi:hypothetical protein
LARTTICHLKTKCCTNNLFAGGGIFYLHTLRADMAWHGTCDAGMGSTVCLCQMGARELLQFEHHKEVFMLKRALLAASAAISIPLIFSGVSLAQQVVCNPLCSPGYNHSNSADDHRGQGLRHANDVAGKHGFEGRDNARLKQDAHRPGGSGVPDPTPVPPPVPPPVIDPVPPPPPPLSAPGTTCTLCAPTP